MRKDETYLRTESDGTKVYTQNGVIIRRPPFKGSVIIVGSRQPRPELKKPEK
jgi:hypothetical protein